MSSNQEFDKTAVLTIQGGGVYGLGLLGQLAAVIDQFEIDPLAVAGSSAGAIIATLYWAGLTPKGIRDKLIERSKAETKRKARRRGGLVSLLDPVPIGRRDYRFKKFKKFYERCEHALGLDVKRGTPRTRRHVAFRRGLRRCTRTWCGVRALATLIRHRDRLGFFPGDELEAFVDECLRGSPRLAKYRDELPSGRPLTFGDVRDLGLRHPDDDDTYFCPLILTATNLTTRKLVLIRSYKLEDEAEFPFARLPIARAVRASAGFPIFFAPVELGEGVEAGRYVDGGVISNFPAWVFSSELRRQLAGIEEYRDVARRPWLSIGLTQVEAASEAEDAPTGLWQVAGALVGLVTGQVRNELEGALTSRLPRYVAVEQPYGETGFSGSLLDVDTLDEDKIHAMFGLGYICAGAKLSKRSFSLPCNDDRRPIEAALARLVRQSLGVFAQADNESLRFRANVFLPTRDVLFIRFSYNMGGPEDHDAGLTFQVEPAATADGLPTGLTGACFRTRRPWLSNLEALRLLAEARPVVDLFGMTAEHRRLIRADRTWLANVPIFDPRDSSFRPPRVARPPRDVPSFFPASELGTCLEGAVFGVLNLDASISYEGLNLDPDTEYALKDPRIEAIFSILQAASIEIGFILSDAFGVAR